MHGLHIFPKNKFIIKKSYFIFVPLECNNNWIKSIFIYHSIQSIIILFQTISSPFPVENLITAYTFSREKIQKWIWLFQAYEKVHGDRFSPKNSIDVPSEKRACNRIFSVYEIFPEFSNRFQNRFPQIECNALYIWILQSEY